MKITSIFICTDIQLAHLWLRYTRFRRMICLVLHTKVIMCCLTGELSLINKIDILPEYTLGSDAYTLHSSWCDGSIAPRVTELGGNGQISREVHTCIIKSRRQWHPLSTRAEKVLLMMKTVLNNRARRKGMGKLGTVKIFDDSNFWIWRDYMIWL